MKARHAGAIIIKLNERLILHKPYECQFQFH